MERKVKIESNIAQILERVTAAQQCLHHDPELAAKLLKLTDENLHRVIDDLLPTGVGATD
jgi:hypothetical protein